MYYFNKKIIYIYAASVPGTCFLSSRLSPPAGRTYRCIRFFPAGPCACALYIYYNNRIEYNVRCDILRKDILHYKRNSSVKGARALCVDGGRLTRV